MSIVKTISNDYEFYEWLCKSDNYKNSFSQEGAKAVQAYYEQLSDDLGENIEFDPIAWCCEFSEYESYSDVWDNYGNGDAFVEGEELAIDDNIRLWLENNTQYIELENGNVLVREF